MRSINQPCLSKQIKSGETVGHRLNFVNTVYGAGALQIPLPIGLSRQAQSETNFNFPVPPSMTSLESAKKNQKNT